MKKFIPHPSALIPFLFVATAVAQPVRITQKPEGLVHGMLYVPASVAENVTRVELYVNGVKWTEASGRSVVMPVNIGDYIRRLRIRAVGYDAQNNVVGEDEMVVNDPKPPFRVRLDRVNEPQRRLDFSPAEVEAPRRRGAKDRR